MICSRLLLSFTACVYMCCKDKDQQAIWEGIKINQALRENWKANDAHIEWTTAAVWIYTWCHSDSLSGLSIMLDWLHLIVVYSLVDILFCFQFRVYRKKTTDGHAYTYRLPYPVLLLSHTLHCSFNKFTISYRRSHTHIRDWNRLPPLSHFDWSSSSQGASIFKRCFVACRHSSIEQKHAHDGPMNNTLMREIVPAVVRSRVCLNCLMSLSSIWRIRTSFYIYFSFFVEARETTFSRTMCQMASWPLHIERTPQEF